MIKVRAKISVLLLIVTVFSSVNFAFAESISDLTSQQKYLQSQIAKNKKEQEEKAKQAAELQRQIQNVTLDISATENAIETTAGHIEEVNKNIEKLIQEIEAEEKNLAAEKDKMNKIIASWYMEGESGLMEALIGSGSLSEVVSRQQYYESVRQQIELSIERIEKIKSDLGTQKDQKNRELTELSNLKTSQTEQANYLEGKKQMKGRLLNDTSDALSDLKDEEKIAQEKIAELQSKIDRIRSMSNTGGQIVSSNDSSWYYSQLDSRWSSVKIGKYATIGQYGCLLTSLAMIASFYGSNVNPAEAAAQSSFNRSGGASDGALYYTSIVNDGGSTAINWSKVDSELASGHPVVVGVSLGIDMGNSYGVSHFVVLKSKIGPNKYAMHDPLGDGRGYNMSQVKAMRIVRPR